MEHLIETYGYGAILLGTFFEGETILVLGGFSAHRGWLALGLVILVAFAGSVSGDQLWYFIGRRRGAAILARRPAWRSKVAGVSARIHRHQNWIVLVMRFLYGLRIVIPFAVGAAGVPASRFLLLNVLGAAVWAVAFGCGGYWIGEALATFLPQLEHYELEALGAIALTGAVVFGVSVWRRSRRRPPVDGA